MQAKTTLSVEPPQRDQRRVRDLPRPPQGRPVPAGGRARRAAGPQPRQVAHVRPAARRRRPAPGATSTGSKPSAAARASGSAPACAARPATRTRPAARACSASACTAYEPARQASRRPQLAARSTYRADRIACQPSHDRRAPPMRTRIARLRGRLTLRQRDRHAGAVHRPRRHRLRRDHAAAQQRRRQADPQRTPSRSAEIRNQRSQDCATSADRARSSAARPARTRRPGRRRPASPSTPRSAPAAASRRGTPRELVGTSTIAGLYTRPVQARRRRLRVLGDARRGARRRRDRARRPGGSRSPRRAAPRVFVKTYDAAGNSCPAAVPPDRRLLTARVAEPPLERRRAKVVSRARRSAG